MDEKYFSGENVKFTVKNEDGTFNETININKHIVEDAKDFVAFLKATYEPELSDVLFEVFVECCLSCSLFILNKNRKMIVKCAGGDNDGI